MEEIAQLGGSARIISDGVILVGASSMPADDVMRVRSVETCSILVGTLTLTGKASPDLDTFKHLCHPTAGEWGAMAPSRWNLAAVKWVRARRAAMLRHGMGLGDEKEGPAPEENMTWDAVEKDVYAREEDGRLQLRGDTKESRGEGGGQAHPHPVSFRVSCVRFPGEPALKHGYKSLHVNHELGWSLGVTHPSWRVDLKRATLTVEVVIKGKFAAVALQVAAAAESRRMRRVVATATTRSHLAAAMVRLARPALGEVIVDIGCGMGNIMSEAAQHNCNLRDPRGRGGERGGEGEGGGARVVLGGDVVYSSAALAADNLADAAPSLCYDVCAWSMEHLPLRTASQGEKKRERRRER